MSAILPGAPFASGSRSLDGIRRYRTRAKVQVCSHNSPESFKFFHEIVAIQSNKHIKGAGTINITFLPTTNLLNCVFPNDYVHVYFDTGDGNGWVRSFLGLVDRVEEQFEVGADGKPSTRYFLICSDFHKIPEKTDIYFNPQLHKRADVRGLEFGATNIGGLALASKGITVGGSPPDIVTNVLLLTIGFGAQWTLPDSYQISQNLVQRSRQAEFALGRLSSDSQRTILSAQGYAAFRAQLEEEVRANKVVNVGGTTVPLDQYISTYTEGSGPFTPEQLNEEVQVETLRRVRNTLTANSNRISSSFSRYDSNESVSILENTLSTKRSFLDILDIFSFVERRAIDGYLSDAPVWQHEGSLLSILSNCAHEVMNELFFDLRPMVRPPESNEEDGYLIEGGYSTEPDEIGGNNPDEYASAQGIQLMPCLVMREYPFSTIGGVDTTGVSLNLQNEQGVNQFGSKMHFGAIFSDRPNLPGRHVITIPNINWQDKADGNATAFAPKHLDVAVVSEQEVFKTSFGRSDADSYNLFEFEQADVQSSESRKFILREILPILTPIHIFRHGLRRRTVVSRFSNFSYDISQSAGNAPPPESVTEASVSEEENLPQTPTPTSVVVPCDPAKVKFDNNQSLRATNRWGYRIRPFASNDSRFAWRMHQGIDIAPESPRDTTVEVRAIADGIIVASVPDGGFENYGNIVVIKHEFPSKGTVYSVYAHLASRQVGLDLSTSRITKTQANKYVVRGECGRPFGRMQPIVVRQGDVLGVMGNTGHPRAPGGIHLHFEIDRKFPPKDKTKCPDIWYSSSSEGPELASFSPTRPPVPSTFTDSVDPVLFFQEFGMDLVDLLQGTGAETEDLGDQTDVGDPDPQDTNPNRSTTLQNAGAPNLANENATTATQLVGAQDTIVTRQQLLRWALLQDHWYQHNLEYLSGQITMRGAPEIRVGYRLDFYERNMSFYVEAVNHAWQYPDRMTTTLVVTRGQPNNPYPHYVFPKLEPFGARTTQRLNDTSRLAQYFVTPDPIAVRRALALSSSIGLHQNKARDGVSGNTTDETQQDENFYDDVYGERITAAGPTFIEDDLLANSSSEDVGDVSGSSLAGFIEDPEDT